MPNDLSNMPELDSTIVHHASYGAALPERDWVPAPRYLLRRDLLLSIFADLKPGHVLEMGCGAGALLNELARRGFSALGVDFSQSARDLANAMNVGNGRIHIASSTEAEQEESFDYLCAFEVLEHIEDDLGTLRDWTRYLKPNGTLIISVPAHPERWNPADEWAGHYRRYRRDGLTEMVTSAGYEVTDVQCYGFPLANIMERMAGGIYARQSAAREREALDQTQRTEESGADRKLLTKLWPFYSLPPMTLAMRLAWKLQRMSIRSDRGIGYIVTARKV